MPSKHSWKWLTPRFTSRHQLSSSSLAPRACLSAMESLDDRILLSSAVPADLIEVKLPPPVASKADLVSSMLKGGFKITQDEFALFKFVANSSPVPIPYPNSAGKLPTNDVQIVKVLDKASPLLFQLNDAVFDLGESLIKGQLTGQKVLFAKSKIEYLGAKLEDVLISSYSVADQVKIVPLLATVKFDIGLLTDKILSDTITGGVAADAIYAKLTDDAQKVDELTIKGQLDFIKNKTYGLLPDDYKGKIEELLNKDREMIATLSESEVKILLPAIDSVADGTTKLLGSLGSAGGGDGGGDFDGGITLTRLIDDIII